MAVVIDCQDLLFNLKRNCLENLASCLCGLVVIVRESKAFLITGIILVTALSSGDVA